MSFHHCNISRLNCHCKMECLPLASLMERRVKERESTGRPVLLSQSHQLKIPSSECTAATSSRVRRGGGAARKGARLSHMNPWRILRLPRLHFCFVEVWINSVTFFVLIGLHSVLASPRFELSDRRSFFFQRNPEPGPQLHNSTNNWD